MEHVALLEGMSKKFVVGRDTVIAAERVELAVRPGEFVCIYGASGSGKTTLLNIVAGLLLPDSGRVQVVGQDLSQMSEGGRADLRLTNVGVVFQSNNLLPEFTARENVALPLLVRGLSRVDTQTRTSDALAEVGLLELADRLPSDMSGGQRQRVGIARALAGEQPLIVADEPTGALDSENSRRLFALLRELCDQKRTAVLLATHDPLAEQYADTTYVMVDGVVSAR